MQKNKFPVMRELVQRWCRCRKTFASHRSSVEIAAVSTAVSESEESVSALGWHGSWPGQRPGKSKGREEGKGKSKQRERQKVDGGLNRSVFTVDSAGNGATRRPSVPIGREDDRWKLVQRCLTRRQQQLLTLDPLCRNVFGLRIPSRCNLAVGRLRMRPMRIGPRNGVKTVTGTGDWYGDWWWPAPEDQPNEWQQDESGNLVCGAVGSSSKQQRNEKAKLMIDSVSQSTACGVQFAKD